MIISEPSNPWITGVANLFTRDFFELTASRLAPGGIFAQWFHLYGMSEASNAEGTEFGDERILECVQASPSGIEPGELVKQVMAAVRDFTVGEPQGDDITVLVVRYRG